jgi:hypothetical protein
MISNGEEGQNPIISDKVLSVCTISQSVSSLLADNPRMSPSEAWRSLYDHAALTRNEKVNSEGKHGEVVGSYDLERARRCGRWGPTNPSNLFLRVKVFEIHVRLS